MALSKSTRIIILLVIDIAFFLLELITGYAVHSLALVADSFHMLNDVLSLFVGLWAVKVANTRGNSKIYTYGWQRAETLGALVNGVFLVALCVTIFLDAIQRFVEPQIVSNPKLVLIVGCLGLGSNLLGLFLFHEHSHGPGGHSHGPEGSGDHVRDAEEGHVHSQQHTGHSPVADASGNVDVLPQDNGWPRTQSLQTDLVSDATAVETASPAVKRDSKHKHTRSRSRAYSDYEDIHINPGAFRRSIIEASRMGIVDSDEEQGDENAVEDDDGHSHDHSHQQPLLKDNKQTGYGAIPRKSIDHKQHKHAQPRETGHGHGHSHGDLNMRGIFLHVMGDALGNVGVIATALFIWLTDFSWRYYFDPLVSLVITVIILCSAIPLCKAASRILLQAVPAGISVDDIQDDIQDLPGIISCHHLHVWQLSDTKLVASLHVQVDFDFKEEGSARYMQLAQAIRQCLHEYGIHSSTIQPEFCLDPNHNHSPQIPDGSPTDHAVDESLATAVRRSVPTAPDTVRDPDNCLLDCGDECGGTNSCCPGPSAKGTQHAHEGHGHEHGH